MEKDLRRKTNQQRPKPPPDQFRQRAVVADEILREAGEVSELRGGDVGTRHSRVWASGRSRVTRVELALDPIFDPETGYLSEVAKVTGKKRRVVLLHASAGLRLLSLS